MSNTPSPASQLNPLWLGFLVLVVVVGIASAVGGEEQEEAPPADPMPAVPVVPSEPAPTLDDVAQQARTYLEEGYTAGDQQPSWYSSIEEIRQTGFGLATLQIDTSLFPDGDATGPAESICMAFALGIASGDISKVEQVEVRDSQGGELATCP